MSRWPVQTEGERFDSLWVPEPNSGCHLWIGSLARGGYGQFRRVNGKTVKSHRFAFERARGPVPPGSDLDHLCRTRCCVNPSHLDPVSRKENVRRGNGHGSETHCAQGHAYAGDNLIITKKGFRRCRTCARRWRREHSTRNRQFH